MNVAEKISEKAVEFKDASDVRAEVLALVGDARFVLISVLRPMRERLRQPQIGTNRRSLNGFVPP